MLIGSGSQGFCDKDAVLPLHGDFKSLCPNVEHPAKASIGKISKSFFISISPFSQMFVRPHPGRIYMLCWCVVSQLGLSLDARN